MYTLHRTSPFLMKMKNHAAGGTGPSRKQYRQFMQALQDEAGTGPGSPGPVCGRHKPIAVTYSAARGALGVVDKAATSSKGNTTRPITIVSISEDIICVADIRAGR